MKRLLIEMLICLLTVCMLLSSCESNENNSETTQKNVKDTTVSESKDSETAENHDQNDDNNLLTETFKVPMEDIYIDVPEYNHIEEGYLSIYWDRGVRYALFDCLYAEKASTLEEAYQTAIAEYTQYIRDHHYIIEVDNVTTEKVTVNGIETIRFKGTASAGGHPVYNAYVYGYAFIYGGFPCSVIGSVVDESQPQNDIDEITAIADAMMASVRSEK